MTTSLHQEINTTLVDIAWLEKQHKIDAEYLENMRNDPKCLYETIDRMEKVLAQQNTKLKKLRAKLRKYFK